MDNRKRAHADTIKFDLQSVLETLSLDPLIHGLQIVAASELAGDYFPRLDTDRPALVLDCDTAELLERVVNTLRVNYPARHELTLARGKTKKIFPLDTIAYPRAARRAVLYVPPLPYSSSPLTLANIMARLRAPVGGCPWDLEQTHESITRALVEEAYEVIEAISDQDMAHLKEELGDLQLHVLFQTQIARDENEFALSDVGAELAEKLIRRHPHVFGNENIQDASIVLENWEKIKQAEKKSKGQKESANGLDAGIPRNLPALTRAQKISERARRKKFSTANKKPNDAELGLKSKIERARNRERVVGELLLEIARIAEEHGIDAERALNAASKRFVRTRKATGIKH